MEIRFVFMKGEERIFTLKREVNLNNEIIPRVGDIIKADIKEIHNKFFIVTSVHLGYDQDMKNKYIVAYAKEDDIV